MDPRHQRLSEARTELLDQVLLQPAGLEVTEVHLQRFDPMQAIRVAGLRAALVDDRLEALALDAGELGGQLPRGALILNGDLEDLPPDPMALAGHSRVIAIVWLASHPTPVRAWTAMTRTVFSPAGGISVRSTTGSGTGRDAGSIWSALGSGGSRAITKSVSICSWPTPRFCCGSISSSRWK